MSRFLLYGDSYRNPNVFLVTGFLAPDPILYLQFGDSTLLVVPPMERPRAEKESRIADVRTFDDFGYQQAVDRTGSRFEALCEMAANLVGSFPDGAVEVESGFPVHLADRLRAKGLELEPSADLLVDDRRRKSNGAVEALAHAQSQAEKAVAAVREILAESKIVGDRVVFRGVPLTAERLRGEVEVGFIRDGFTAHASIVAPGPRSADPHWEGRGPVLAHQPLILDFFPQSRESRYHGDVTRTFVKGDAPDQLAAMYESVARAQALALTMIRPGANGRDIHVAVQESFAEDGFGDSGPRRARFIHGTGHGLGLEVHEQPSIGKIDMELREGDVVTVEPGLYDEALGGVRIEDVVVVTGGGNRNLNQLPKELVVP
jgi:Xaa-Pro aminopeptidase